MNLLIWIVVWLAIITAIMTVVSIDKKRIEIPKMDSKTFNKKPVMKAVKRRKGAK